MQIRPNWLFQPILSKIQCSSQRQALYVGEDCSSMRPIIAKICLARVGCNSQVLFAFFNQAEKLLKGIHLPLPKYPTPRHSVLSWYLFNNTLFQVDRPVAFVHRRYFLKRRPQSFRISC